MEPSDEVAVEADCCWRIQSARGVTRLPHCCSNLKIVSDETLLEKIDGIDENYLAQDIRADYLQMYDDYFNTIELPKFEIGKIHP